MQKPTVAPAPSSPTPTSVASAEPDPIRADLRAVVDLFTSDLRDVAFPTVDAKVLRQHADEVRAASRDVARARAALDAALATFDERTRALAAMTSRGLAYARIYAADQPALRARLDAITGQPAAVPAAAAPAAPRPRGRPRKHPRPQLPLEEHAADGQGDLDVRDPDVGDHEAHASA